jgi:hypothetical protein
MKLLKEFYTGSDTEVLVEKTETGAKNYFIKGVFMQAEAKNRNGRVYPRPILENELNRYQQLIGEKRSLGELGHPDTPTINLDKVSHLITELQFDGDNIYGKAKILPTPNGEITKSFINEGIKLGVSSRGVGSLKSLGGVNQVQEDFKLSTVDIVADPSAPDAWVTGIMEGKDWVYIDGKFMEQEIEHVQKTIRKASQKDVERVAAQLFESFLKSI